ncbi:MAG: hypothetical protein GWM87_08040, partial [Xanthomonadales bacterium]|nr:hypothetical protein [Xanthomonadales bacterium]NIX12888.1 hypothetical protein [Xanthomonadales bacterium]
MKTRLLLAALLLPLSAMADTIVVSPVNVIGMADGDIRTNQAVVVEDGLIRDILDASGAPRDAEGTTLVDGEGGWVIPGLAEM